MITDPLGIRFQNDGVAHLPGFLPADVCDALATDWIRVRSALAGVPGDLILKRDARFVRGQLPPLLDSLPFLQRLEKLAVTAVGESCPHVYMNRLLLKDNHANAPVTIHQDLPYFDGGNKLSVFVPLADATFDDAPLVFVRGSHRYGRLPRGTVLRDKFPPMLDVCFEWKLGDVILMDFLTWHFSHASASGNPRPVMQICYEPTERTGGNPNSWLWPDEPCALAGATEPDYIA